MKKIFYLSISAALLGGVVGSWLFLGVARTNAQTDAFTFLIPYPADQLDDQFDVATNDEAPGSTVPDITGDDIKTTISIAVMRSGSIIYYDHWEDGLEPNLTEPVQSTTQVWGDGDPSNGSLPATNPMNVAGLDTLTAGDVIVLTNTVTIPRMSTDYFFDGGDKLTALGGNLAVSLAVWPETSGPLFAGAWELYPTSLWGTDYIIPVGEDLSSLRGGFGTVGFNVQALNPNTTVNIDFDGDGSPEITETIPKAGGQFTQINGVSTGTKITTSDVVQVQILTGDPNQIPNAYEARAYTMVPRMQWDDDYIAPRSSDGDYWLYNPDNTDLSINVSTLTTTNLITIPANNIFQYSNTAGLSTATGVRFQSTDGRPFYGIVALDESFRQDWGYGLLPVQNLTSQVLIGWGIGNINPTPTADESRLYVSAIKTTTVSIDFENDGVVDQIITVPPLAEIPVTDPDHDLTGAFLFTDNKDRFVTVWGQDQGANAELPSVDVGTNVVPLPSLVIQKTMNLIDDVDQTGTVTWGDKVEFALRAYNNSDTDLFDGNIRDELPNTIEYELNSSEINGSPIPDDTTGTTPFPLDEGGYNISLISKLDSITVTFNATVKENVDSINNVAFVTSSTLTTTSSGEIDIPIGAFSRYEMDKHLIEPQNGQAEAGDLVTFGIAITSTGNLTITKLPLTDDFIEDHLTYVSAGPFVPDVTASGVVTWHDLAQDTFFGPLPPGRRIELTVTFEVDPLPETVTQTTNIALVSGAEDEDGNILPPDDDDESLIFPPPITITPTPTDDENTPDIPTDDTPTATPVTPTETPVSNDPPDNNNPPDNDDPPDDSSDPNPTPETTPNATPETPTTTSTTPTPSGSSFVPPSGETSSDFPVALLPETGYAPIETKSRWPMVVLVIIGSGVAAIIRQKLKT